ncbi:60S ribosomal protein L7 (nucleomorph) [Guillardia theta]|uniref:60S ribosomal protein L7 n=1 Tax=Guillardia theta TaxID=55529 RepID=Q98S26_GUITH|nr:60S ribosomal protein L7 [Guillardia theta]AAK39754.1 60S ribosomal protein L7 [Guillardia theta]|mmetsp:Transcript_20548/g.68872  ORF Transcript_20548/g.68872 Transcript_20548/m.68872 type:complete len:248 (-) Transcript_20548:11005-11748(-)
MIIEAYPSDDLIVKKKNREKNLTDYLLLEKKIKKKNNIFKKKKKIRIENIIKEYIDSSKKRIRIQKLARKEGKIYINKGPRILFVIRTKGINGIDPKSKKILKLLRLNNVHAGVFLKINKSILKILQYIEPYVAYGYPSIKNVRSLIMKKGFLKLGSRGHYNKISIANDVLIEQRFKKIGISCTEDLVKEIYECGPYFKFTNNLLWPFQLRSPKKGFGKKGKKKSVIEKGVFGNWEYSINFLIEKMI